MAKPFVLRGISVAIPTKKSPVIDAMITRVTGIDRKEAIMNSMCATCSKHALGFKDSESFKEYEISGMCQKCQDEFYGGSDA